MSLYKQFKTNTEVEKNGVWIPYGETEQGEQIAFKVARIGPSNKKYQKAIERATKPYRRQIELGTINEKVAERLYMDVFVNTVLLGWQNVTNEQNEPMEFNKANALKLFEDLPELYNDLHKQASTASLFQEDLLEGDAKN